MCVSFQNTLNTDLYFVLLRKNKRRSEIGAIDYGFTKEPSVRRIVH